MNALAIFDLDDTLIDTRGTLLMPALARVARILGVPVEQLDATGKRIDEVLHPLLGPFLGTIPPHLREAAASAWYDPEVPALDPLPEAHAMLDELAGKIHLALLTRGDPQRQANKIRQCGLRDYFEAVRIRAIEEAGSKRDDIAALMLQFEVPPSRTIVIGDDERDELTHARALGCAGWKVPELALVAIPERLRAGGWIASS